MNTVFLEKICRCCLNESDQLTNLFDPVIGIDIHIVLGDCFTYSDALFLCTNVRCDVDILDVNKHVVEFPRNLCDICKQELSAALSFRTKCKSSDSLLREQTSRPSVQNVCQSFNGEENREEKSANSEITTHYIQIKAEVNHQKSLTLLTNR